MSNKNTLYLIPTPISKRKENLALPEHTLSVIRSLNCFVVEKMQTTESFLQWIKHPTPTYKQTFRVLNKKTPDHEVISFMNLLSEEDVGLMSEAGAPAVADPGAKLVNLAHQQGHPVVPLIGPSSILLALMGSGMNGQSFTFHGYLPIQEKSRIQEIQELEKESAVRKRTQIFMETPHRNSSLYDQLLKHCRLSTRLCIACNLTAEDEFLKTKPVYEWKAEPAPDLQKKPALFLIYADN
ncbi:SAM-dependent methyltransferase [Rhodohalobacter sp. SW132]|uniref:SAM-dependent methyltransferase n=1 Tax=Rhodohalobacter sp. SW132 TaxID=2293433 RepID=UPI000E267BD5|nr:SAM-dependent methyltransferase [Rhodohalobacter sp. SW132]REL38285.1 SAM-dependent methyltransferase [Rhodohalobacter sp. SW132]